MDNNKIAKAREFCEKVRILANEYNLPFFIVTDGASSTQNNGCEAVKNARNNHIKWEKENGFNPDEDWENAELINDNIPQNERLVKLNNSAIRQMRILKNDKSIRKLETLNKNLIETK